MVLQGCEAPPALLFQMLRGCLLCLTRCCTAACASPLRAVPRRPTRTRRLQVEKVMKALYVRRLYLWPRFQAQAREDLEARPPQVSRTRW